MMMQPQLLSSASMPTLSSPEGMRDLSLDHYKYLRSLLPSYDHFIESLSFTDLNSWECQIEVKLQTESDCMKWLSDFEDKTNTSWKIDNNAVRAHQPKTKSNVLTMVYICEPLDSKKDCSGRLEMKLNQDDPDRNRKQYPCQVNINFYHNHTITTNTVLTMESFKSQDIPSHLKEGFEGYFQETMQPIPVTNGTTINLNTLKPHPPTMLSSPLTLSTNPPHVVIKPETIQMSPGQGPTSTTQHLDGKLLSRGPDMIEVNNLSHKLDIAMQVLKGMLKEPGTGVGAVKHFVEKFEKLQGDQTQLEDALTSFGGQWDWLVATDTSVSGTQVPPVMVTAPLTTQQPLIHSPSADLASPKLKKKKLKLDEKEVAALTNTPQSVFSTNIVGGQLVLQQQTPVTPTTTETAPDSKKRKRARCGNCNGCLNRDKTQDCRQCRNCLDQKRYGGPGRLKKACIKRQCNVITQMSGSSNASVVTNGVIETDGAKVVSVVTAPTVVTAQKSEPPVITSGQPQQQQPVQFSVKSEPLQFSVKSEPAVSVATSHTSAPTLLSWPAGQYQPTFQLQTVQPVQFAFQPTSYSGVSGVTNVTTPLSSQAAPGQLQFSTVPSISMPPQLQTLTPTPLGTV